VLLTFFVNPADAGLIGGKRITKMATRQDPQTLQILSEYLRMAEDPHLSWPGNLRFPNRLEKIFKIS
jgi:hypothetical protein